MTNRLRIAVAGCGTIAEHVHLPLLSASADAQVLALADVDVQRADALGRTFGVPQTFGSLDQLLEKCDVDAVLVATPTGDHASAARLVLEHRKHLYLEKPIASNLAEAEEVLSAWHSSGTVAVTGFNMRFNPLVQRLHTLLQQQRAGKPVYVRSVFSTALNNQTSSWRHQRTTGGGALLDMASHHFDLLPWLLDRPIKRVRATVRSDRHEQDSALVELEFDGKLGAHCFFSHSATELDAVEIHGSHARLTTERYSAIDVEIVDNPAYAKRTKSIARQVAKLGKLPEVWQRLRAPFMEPGYFGLLDLWVKSAQSGTAHPSLPSLIDGYSALAVVGAAEQSAASGMFEMVQGWRSSATKQTVPAGQ